LIEQNTTEIVREDYPLRELHKVLSVKH